MEPFPVDFKIELAPPVQVIATVVIVYLYLDLTFKVCRFIIKYNADY